MAQALDRPGRTPDVIRTQEEYAQARARWRENFNLLTPFESITGLAQQHGIIATQIRINPDPKRGGPGEVYDGLPFLKADDVALSKVGLRKIAEGCGMSTDSVELAAIEDPRHAMYVWKYKGVVTYRGIDGTVVTRTATVTWNLSDGSPRLKGWTKNQVEEGRKVGGRACEARAINAAIREAGTGIKQAYTRAELGRPFLAIRVMFQPDMSDAATRHQVTAAALQGTAALYGRAAPALPAPAPWVDPYVEAVGSEREPEPVREPRPVRSSTAPAAAKPEPSATVDAGAPPVEGAVKVVKVETKTKHKEGNKRPTVWYLVVDSLGVERSTFDKAIADAAQAFETEGCWVEIDEERSGDFLNIIGIQRAGSSPALDFDGALE